MRMRLAALIGVFCFSGFLPAQQAVDYRLPPGIAPLAQEIRLVLDPARPDYSGSTAIDLQIDEPVERIGVYQVGLALDSVTLSTDGGSRSLRSTPGDWDITWLQDGDPIEPGRYRLSIDFSGEYSTDALGMHRVRFEDNDYVFTQMEAMYARRAFPVFDEPSFKLPYRLSITAPTDLTVIANTPVEEVLEAGERRTVRFMETRPLPSYLLAFAVGPLDRAPLEGLSVPGYVYTPKGHADEVGFVQRETPRIVAALEAYFGSEYPFRKLDFVAVPDFAFGAMENPGLITYRTDLLLVGDQASGTTAEQVLNVIAHEVAHIWYGDVVTMKWWDDLWLNEAFATWMARRVLEELYPQYDPELKLPQSGAFVADQQTSVQPIRRTVRNNEEIFDGLGLNYSKGHALLGMLESYVGSESWREAIRAYIDRFAWSNATERDLWDTIGRVSGIDVGAIAGDYLNQPGFALVSIGEDGEVRQQRYLLPGATAPELDWSVPLNIKYKADGDIRQTFYLLDGKTGTLDLPEDAAWVFPDAGGNGYYRWMTDSSQFYALVEDADVLSNREKIALLDNTEALFNANRLTLADYLFVIDRFLEDPYPLVFWPTLEKLKVIGDDFVGPSTEEGFAAFVDEAVGPRFDQVGARTRAGDDEAILQLRPRLLRMLGEYGADAGARKAAREIATDFLAAPGSVDTNLAREALRVTAMHDDGSLYDDYIATYRAAESAGHRSVILTSIYFDNPAVIRRHLDFSLSDEVAAGDALTGLNLYAAILDDNTPVFTWLERNFDALLAKIPAYYHALLPQAVGGGCSEASRRRLNEFFSGRGTPYETTLGKADEAAAACIERKRLHGEKLVEFLARYERG